MPHITTASRTSAQELTQALPVCSHMFNHNYIVACFFRTSTTCPLPGVPRQVSDERKALRASDSYFNSMVTYNFWLFCRNTNNSSRLEHADQYRTTVPSSSSLPHMHGASVHLQFEEIAPQAVNTGQRNEAQNHAGVTHEGGRKRGAVIVQGRTCTRAVKSGKGWLNPEVTTSIDSLRYCGRTYLKFNPIQLGLQLQNQHTKSPGSKTNRATRTMALKSLPTKKLRSSFTNVSTKLDTKTKIKKSCTEHGLKDEFQMVFLDMLFDSTRACPNSWPE
ncbi:hypothetical protein B0H13DRAFT_1865944 [Mycena leptocephala]|nr:hypothetical protein B0H13DRAFT_1865944 [Mycena leptocephala]